MRKKARFRKFSSADDNARPLVTGRTADGENWNDVRQPLSPSSFDYDPIVRARNHD